MGQYFSDAKIALHLGGINVNHGKWYERKLKELFQHRGHAAKPEDKGATVCTENQF